MFNSMAGHGHRGERPNELSGSWFPPKCLAGQRRACRRMRYGGCGRSQQTRNVWAPWREHGACLERASGRAVVSMARKEERTSEGDKWPDAGQGANVWSRYGQQGGGHGGWHPLRSVLQRTCRIAGRGKWMALTCGTRPPTQVRGRRACGVPGKAGRGCGWRRAQRRSWK